MSTGERRGAGDLRALILRAASELLDESGNEQAVTLRAVARRVGVTAPALYTHFENRQQILLAVVGDAFDDLEAALTHAGRADAAPGEQLRAVCAAYLAFAADHPQRYRVMFGGLWSAAEAVEQAAITADEATGLGGGALSVLADSLAACADAGVSSSTDARADAVALWLGLHGLAHQRAVIPAFPWPDGIADRVVAPLAHLTRLPEGDS